MERSAGILLPIFSLPGTPGTGTIGAYARRFADFLSEAGCRWWQLLPINPIDSWYSPYSSSSAFAGEILYIDPEELYKAGLLDSGDLPSEAKNDSAGLSFADYEYARKTRTPLLRKAFELYKTGKRGKKYRDWEEEFLKKNRFWLDDHIFFRVLAEKFGTEIWSQWPEEYRYHDQTALSEIERSAGDKIAYYRFLQLVFDSEWQSLRTYCRDKGVKLLGDVPIYVGISSVDTWSHRELFRIDKNGTPERITGAPADDFNPDGQRWDSPLYNWDRMAETGYDWWLKRLWVTLSRFDAVRLDHFIGFYNYYSFPLYRRDRSLPVQQDEPTNGLIPATPIDCDGGFWTAGPKEDFLDTIFSKFSHFAFIAEDLGVMTPGVHALRNHYKLPGMNVLLFSYEEKSGEDRDPMRALKKNAVACTGTHDTQTLRGWLKMLRSPDLPVPIDYRYVAGKFAVHLTRTEKAEFDIKRALDPLLASEEDIKHLVWGGIRSVLKSRPDTALVPIQDFLFLDDDARMNFPGHPDGNWIWRLREGDLTSELAMKIRKLVEQTHRIVTV